MTKKTKKLLLASGVWAVLIAISIALWFTPPSGFAPLLAIPGAIGGVLAMRLTLGAFRYGGKK